MGPYVFGLFSKEYRGPFRRLGKKP
jgi:hypothetical protein